MTGCAKVMAIIIRSERNDYRLRYRRQWLEAPIGSSAELLRVSDIEQKSCNNNLPVEQSRLVTLLRHGRGSLTRAKNVEVICSRRGQYPVVFSFFLFLMRKKKCHAASLKSSKSLQKCNSEDMIDFIIRVRHISRHSFRVVCIVVCCLMGILEPHRLVRNDSSRYRSHPVPKSYTWGYVLCRCPLPDGREPLVCTEQIKVASGTPLVPNSHSLPPHCSNHPQRISETSVA